MTSAAGCRQELGEAMKPHRDHAMKPQDLQGYEAVVRLPTYSKQTPNLSTHVHYWAREESLLNRATGKTQWVQNFR